MVAMYPSPAGATESELQLAAWEDLTALNPVLDSLEPDAEALVVNRISDQPSYVIAPIDECYALVGAVKVNWEGISGGDAIERAVPTSSSGCAHAPGRIDERGGDERSTGAALRIHGRPEVEADTAERGDTRDLRAARRAGPLASR